MVAIFGLTMVKATTIDSLVLQAGAGKQLAVGIKALSLMADPDCAGKLERLHEGYRAFASGDTATLEAMVRELGGSR